MAMTLVLAGLPSAAAGCPCRGEAPRAVLRRLYNGPFGYSDHGQRARYWAINPLLARSPITPETHIEGKPKVKSRVTVQYVADEEGDRAVQIIVRSPSQKKPG